MSECMPEIGSWKQPGRGAGDTARLTSAVRKAVSFRPAAFVAALGLTLFTFLAPVRLFAQDVVVFTDQRSLVVSSHREEGGWVFLRLDGGEVAVPKALIAEIRNEGSQARESAKAVAQLVGPAPSPSEEESNFTPHPAEEAQIQKPLQIEKPKGPWQPPVAGAVATRPASAGLRNSGAAATLTPVTDQQGQQGVKKR